MKEAVDRPGEVALPEFESTSQVPEGVRPPPGNPRFPLFDGLRAMAAISILVLHSSYATLYTNTGLLGRWMANLDIGVAIFFVISGFLLYRPFVEARFEGKRGPHTLRFYQRRVLRIVPAYWFALTVLAVFGLSRATPTSTLDHWPKYYFFLQNYTTSFEGIGPAWSLCVEMSFYLVLPLYAWLLFRLLSRSSLRRQVTVEAVILVVLSLVSLPFWRAFANGESLLFHQWLPHYFYWFAIGMGLAILSAWSVRTGAAANRLFTALGRHPGAMWLAALALFVVLGFITVPALDFFTDTPGTAWAKWLLQPLIALLVVAPAVFSRPGVGIPGRLLAWAPVAWLGLISYGIFLWHLAVQFVLLDNGWIGGPDPAARTVVSVILVLAFTVPIAAFSYYVIERPFLRLKERGRV